MSGKTKSSFIKKEGRLGRLKRKISGKNFFRKGAGLDCGSAPFLLEDEVKKGNLGILLRGKDHDQKHLEALDCPKRVRDARGHDDHLALLQCMRFSADRDPGLAVENED